MYLHKTFEFASFEEAMEYMQRATAVISRINHHPEWTNRYNRVDVRLTTHDQGNVVTQRDHQLATALDQVFAETPASTTKTTGSWQEIS
jgi:4a-hydroxytetrahydrobiopterin dehydratase